MTVEVLSLERLLATIDEKRPTCIYGAPLQGSHIRHYGPKPPKPLPEAGWRFFYDYLERRIQAVKLGITDLVEEFTASIVMQLPDGSQVTLGDSVKLSIADPSQATLPFIHQREAAA